MLALLRLAIVARVRIRHAYVVAHVGVALFYATVRVQVVRGFRLDKVRLGFGCRCGLLVPRDRLRM